MNAVFVLVCIGCCSWVEQGDKVPPGKLETYAAVKQKLEKEGWQTAAVPIDLPVRQIEPLDLKKSTFPLPKAKDEQPTHVRYTWVVVHGPIDIAESQKSPIDLYVKTAEPKVLVFQPKGGKAIEMSLAEEPIRRSSKDDWDTRFKYTPSGKSPEKLLIIQRRVELLRGDKVVGTGFTSACGTNVFKKLPEKKKAKTAE